MDNLGISAGAEFFTSLASVEMYLNRAYSMASDNYLDDAKQSLDISVDKLQMLLKKAVDFSHRGVDETKGLWF